MLYAALEIYLDFIPPTSLIKNISIIEVDLLINSSLNKIPDDIDIAYYLVH